MAHAAPDARSIRQRAEHGNAPDWWNGLEHGHRCLRCDKGKVYDYGVEKGVWCNRCGRLDHPTRRNVAPDLHRHDDSALYLHILRVTRFADPEIQALVRASDGRISDSYIQKALGGRRTTAVARFEAAVAEVPWLALRPGKQGVASRQIIVIKHLVPKPVVNQARKNLSRQRGGIARARNTASGATGIPVLIERAASLQHTASSELVIGQAGAR